MMMRSVCGLLLATVMGAGAQVQTQGWITADETWTGQVEVVGDVMVTNNATLTIAAGAEITFMSNGLAIYLAGTDSSGRIRLLGEATNRIRVGSVPGLVTNGTIGRYPNLYGREVRAEYVDFRSLGYFRGDTRGYSVYNAPNAGDSFVVLHCTFSNCYDVGAIAYHTTALVEVAHNDFRSSSTNLALQLQGAILDQPSNRVVFGNTSDAGFLLASSALVTSNVLVGSNAFISLVATPAGTVVERNYVYYERVSSGAAISSASSNVVVRDNFVSGGADSIRITGATSNDVLGNVVQCMTGQSRHVSGQSSRGRLAGNILFGAQPSDTALLLNTERTNVVIKNNVINPRSATAVSFTVTGAVAGVSLRNNIFLQAGAATRPVVSYAAGLTNLLASTDFNCFYSTNAAIITNYSGRVTVAGKTMRVDAGFGLNDLTAGGPANEQVNPLLAGALEAITVTTPAQMLARAHTIDEVLAEARTAFALQAGSPCRDAGDPADDGEADVADGQRDIGLEYGGGGPGPTDADGDGMEDGWELLHFGNTTNGAYGDVDTDTLFNVEEFVAQTQPTNAGSRFVVTAFTNGAARYVQVPTVTGRLYRLWSTPALVPAQVWTEVAGPEVGTGGNLALTDGLTTNFGVYRLTVEMETP